jgi:uncharacterized damage-inducible protein DinB
MLAEFETQAPVTRRFLERLPEDKLTWKPHEKSMTAGQLAFHLATVPGGIVRFVQSNPAQAPKSFEFPQPATRAEILKAFDESVATVRNVLPQFSDAAMKETWHMLAGDKEIMAQPRAQPLVPAPRPIQRLSAPAQCRRAGKLGPQCRRAAVIHEVTGWRVGSLSIYSRRWVPHPSRSFSRRVG